MKLVSSYTKVLLLTTFFCVSAAFIPAAFLSFAVSDRIKQPTRNSLCCTDHSGSIFFLLLRLLPRANRVFTGIPRSPVPRDSRRRSGQVSRRSCGGNTSCTQDYSGRRLLYIVSEYFPPSLPSVFSLSGPFRTGIPVPYPADRRYRVFLPRSHARSGAGHRGPSAERHRKAA